MENKEIEDLIQLLDPHRDYGDRSYKEVVESVRNGPPLGVMKQGTGKKAWVTIFEERGASDIDAVYDSLINSAMTGDTKAQIYFFDRMFGKPRESRDTQNADVLANFFASFAGTRMAQVEEQNVQNNDIIVDMED
jgi:hypothetical protein